MTCSILGPFFGPRDYMTHYWCIYPKRPWPSVNSYVSRDRPPNNPRYCSPRSQGPDMSLCLTNTPPHGQTDLDTQRRHWLYTQDINTTMNFDVEQKDKRISHRTRLLFKIFYHLQRTSQHHSFFSGSSEWTYTHHQNSFSNVLTMIDNWLIDK